MSDANALTAPLSEHYRGKDGRSGESGTSLPRPDSVALEARSADHLNAIEVRAKAARLEADA